MELKDSKIWQNLLTAFAGEPQAHTKYLYYASKIEKRGMFRLAHCSGKRRYVPFCLIVGRNKNRHCGILKLISILYILPNKNEFHSKN